jgi:hypothetical protein
MANNYPDAITISSATPAIPEGVSYATEAPSVTSGFRAGDTWYVTPLGTAGDAANATEVWRFDGTQWVKSPSGGSSAASAAWATATTDPTATGNTGTLPRFVENTVNGSKWYIDATGAAKLIESGTAAPTGVNVYLDTDEPSTATIFDDENPPVTDDPALKEDSANTYYGTDGSVWTWNGTEYVTKTYNFTTEQSDVITAAAGQTAFTLSKAPVGKIYGYRNGVKLPTAWSWVGVNVTYLPAGNGSKTIDANDVISFEYEAY